MQITAFQKPLVQRALQEFGKPLIALETLTGIRKNRRGTPRGRRELDSWSYRQLQAFTEYKARERNIPDIYVNPA
jgi:IS605 OrfB family transposase